MDRRRFIGAAAAVGAGMICRLSGAAEAPTARTPLRLLVLGGTRFIGIHLTRLATERGHRVTLFNRGKTNAGLFPELEHLKGDRSGDLASLQGPDWDVVSDDSGYFPRAVRLSAELLAPHVRQYVFLSTLCRIRQHCPAERRTGRQYGSFHLLAGASRPRRGFPGAEPSLGPDSVRRRTRSGGVRFGCR
jgi:hypothetical protein